MKTYELTEAQELELLEIVMSGTDEPIIYDEIEDFEADADIISLFKAEAELGYTF